MKKFIASLMPFLCFAFFNSTQAQLPPVDFELFATGFSNPVYVTHAGDARIFVLEQAGRIRIIDAGGTVLTTPFLDINGPVSSGGECGLLGLAFHPNYATNGYFYVNYTTNGCGPPGVTRISRFTVSANPDIANAGSEVQLLNISQPYSNHNGGCVEFGPDGYLYIGMGDGGSGGDPDNYSQNGQSLLGKMLRIDVDSGNPYGIPGDNPFINNGSVQNEIWAIGVRNPWRFSFDRQTGDLYIADVGQNAWEEIDFQPASSPGGENYGWRCYEGNQAYNTSGCQGASNYVFPVAEYPHSGGPSGCSVTGGYVYRGNMYPALQGYYFYADYCNGNLWALTNVGGTWQNTYTGSISAGGPTSFGEDMNGEIYATIGGSVYHLVDATPDPCSGTTATVDAGQDIEICDGQSAQLNATISGTPPEECVSQSTTTIGTATSTMPSSGSATGTPNSTPYFGWYTGARIQYLYLTTELSAAGMTPGEISSIAFDVAQKNSGSPNFGGFTISMMHSTATSLSGFLAGTNTVFGPATVITSTGWNTHTFDTPFNWNGTDNILVEICFDNGSSNYSNSDQVRYTNTSYNSCYYDYSDSYGNECALPGGIGSNSQATNDRPNTQFSRCDSTSSAVVYSWAPTSNLSNPNIANPVATPTASPTTYSVSATFVNGCVRTDDVAVTVNPVPQLSFSVTDETTVGANDGAIDLTVTGGVPAYSYGWSTGANIEDIQNLSAGTYTVTVTDANGCEAVGSATVNVGSGPCVAVSNLWVDPITTGSARLNWMSASGAHHYTIRGRGLGATNWTVLNIPNGSPNYKDAFGLTDNQEYEWQIQTVCDAAGTSVSPWSALDTFRVDCYGPDSSWTANVSQSCAALSWDQHLGVAGYEIRGRRVGTTNWLTILVGPLNSSFTACGLQPGLTYEWTMRSWCNVAGTNVSAWLSLTTFTTQSAFTRLAQTEMATEQIEVNSLRLIPNPAQNRVSLKFTGFDPIETAIIELFDISGKSVMAKNSFQFENNEAVLDIQNLSSGVYHLSVQNSEVNEVVKLVVH